MPGTYGAHRCWGAVRYPRATAGYPFCLPEVRAGGGLLPSVRQNGRASPESLAREIGSEVSWPPRPLYARDGVAAELTRGTSHRVGPT